MSLHQPVPFIYKRGILVDAFGEQVRFRNKENLKIIADYMNPRVNPDVEEREDRLDEVLSNISMDAYKKLVDDGVI